MRTQRPTILIMVGMALGIVTGHFCHILWPNPDTAKSIAGYISLITDIFLRLIKMIIAPLVFSMLVVGVAHRGDTKAVGRIGAKAMATNEILQIVVFSIFFGVACAAPGGKAKTVVAWTEEISHVILKVTGCIMLLAPLAVFASMAAIITTQGLGILVTYGVFVAEFYLGLAILWCLLAAVGFLIFGRRVFELISLIRQPFLLAFSTASSEAA
jgi:Na+/H+-dicarboxylate symporter